MGLGLLPSGCASLDKVATPQDLAAARTAQHPWQLTNPAEQHEIEGFASEVSVNRGQSTRLFVHTTDPAYTIEIFRMGWYDGAGAKLMMGPIKRTGQTQVMPSPDPETGLIECDWADPFVLEVPATSNPDEWPSGVYLAKLTASASGKQSYILFIVRDDLRQSDILFQTSVTTYQAYNHWGGMSLYTHPQAFKVSFNRPYQRGYGSGDFLFWEYSLLRFLEREGYDVTYTTDVDTHARGHLLLRHKAFLSVGHDEYWSWQMRDNVEAARSAGVNLGFFGANICYWQIRFEPSLVTTELDRTIVCYKKKANRDPLASAADPQRRRFTTTQFRRPPVNRPENQLVGIMHESHRVNRDIVIEDASSWVFQGTGLQKGDTLPGLLGYEVDRIFPQGTPPNIHRVAHSPYLVKGESRYGDMTYYEAPSGSTVVATGSMQWNWGLDESFTLHGRKFADQAVEIATRNILRRFGALPRFGR